MWPFTVLHVQMTPARFFGWGPLVQCAESVSYQPGLSEAGTQRKVEEWASNLGTVTWPHLPQEISGTVQLSEAKVGMCQLV